MSTSVPFKVLLINPPLLQNAETYLDGDKFISESLALAYLKSYLIREFGDTVEVEIVDCYLYNYSVQELSELIENRSPRLLGISVNFHPATEYLFQLCKSDALDQPFVLVGGNYIVAASARVAASHCAI